MIDPEKPVDNPEGFFGRKAVIRRIFSRIGAARPQSVAVIGGVKTGKTSLLNSIFHENTRSEYLDPADSYLFCRADSTPEITRDSKEFLDYIGSQLGRDGPGSENRYHDLQRRVEKLHREKRKIILLLDDFHLITSSPNFPLEFFSFLRSLANNYNVAYVTTSFLELQKLCVVKDIEESPFFNIFTNLSLGPLTESEGIELLESLPGGNPLDGKVTRWCGSFPYILKLAAGTFLEGSVGCGLEGRAAADPDRALLPIISPYYRKVLSILPVEAFNPLKSLSKGKSPDPRQAHLLRPLVKQGFLIETEGTIEPFAPSFASFLRKELSKNLLQGG